MTDVLGNDDWGDDMRFWYSDFCYYNVGGQVFHEHCDDSICDCACH